MDNKIFYLVDIQGTSIIDNQTTYGGSSLLPLQKMYLIESQRMGMPTHLCTLIAIIQSRIDFPVTTALLY